MAISKELARKLVKICEDVYFENMALKVMFASLHIPGWQKMLDRAKADTELASRSHAQFLPLYQKIEQEEDIEAAVADLLRALPTSGSKPN